MCCDDNNYNCVVDFFKSIGLYNEKYFDLIKNNTLILNKDNIDDIGFVASYKFGKMIDFRLYLPELVGLENILIYIHEYGHALFPEDKSDIFPNILESLFMNTYLNIPKKTEELIERTEEQIMKTKSKKHIIEQRIKINYLKHLK